ncbi:WavE lipopolysaccharide synthesis [Haemophilus pittmaniae]|uniref:WavE lipopolysaccharide synthesis n=1 Tax=Haemophilus pittmaniae TaxID=249188 RepID=A0A377IYI1_9PAST|nr:WavE lipopolysaccharide synthesis family protein [Haemophilus pittmaniae]STO93159.1 WavE lipopolysaccharide synthesis [Haemophilus pittmaniae]
MNINDITVVFQGAFNAYIGEDKLDFKENLNNIRRILPGVKIILSTWEYSYVPDSFKFDKIIYNKDPGGLNGIKRREIDKANNINRQIISTYNGLNEVDTAYAIKLRTDCSLEHAGFIDYFKRFNRNTDRFVASCFFTIDPEIYEHMPFHISDWFQFGKTEKILESHRRFLAEKVIILEPWQIGLNFPKYHWTYGSKFASMNCIMFLDWYKNYIKYERVEQPDLGLLDAANKRASKKNKLKIMIDLVEPISNYWYPSRLRRFVIEVITRFTKFL